MTPSSRPARLATFLFALIAAMVPVFAEQAEQGNWPQFRGPDARGVAEGHALPSTRSDSITLIE